MAKLNGGNAVIPAKKLQMFSTCQQRARAPGTETVGDGMAKPNGRNAVIPTDKSQIFSPTEGARSRQASRRSET